MGFSSFLGRVLFASLFILSAWQMFNEFGDNGGPAAKELVGKLAVLKKHVSSHLGVEIPDIDARHLVASIIVQKALGGLLFIFGNLLGACLLVFYLIVASPLLYDFYNYGQDEPEYHTLLNEFLLSIALLGSLLYFIGMKNLIPRRQLKKKVPKAKSS